MTDYVHTPIMVLPPSLLRVENRSFLVIERLNAHNMATRKQRRNLRIKAKKSAGADLTVRVPEATGVSDMDLRFVAEFLENPFFRSKEFWRRVSRTSWPHVPITIDLILLQDYVPDSLERTLDEGALRGACPEWDAIKKHIARLLPTLTADIDNDRLPWGVFMVWLDLIADLENWHDQASPRRERIEHAVFALSSISMSDWFVRDALDRCPDLSTALGGILDGDAPDLEAAQDEPLLPSPGPSETSDVERRVAAIHTAAEAFQASPTRHTFEHLQCAMVAMAEVVDRLPSGEPDARTAADHSISALSQSIDDARTLPGLECLQDTIVDQLRARWKHAIEQATDEAALAAIATDAAAAVGRGSAALASCEAAEQRLKQEAAALEQAQQLPFGSYAEGRARNAAIRDTTARKAEAEEALEAAHDALLGAWSPCGEAFDVTFDYVAALVAATPVEAQTDVIQAGSVPEALPALVEATLPEAVASVLEDAARHVHRDTMAAPSDPEPSSSVPDMGTTSAFETAPTAAPAMQAIPGDDLATTNATLPLSPIDAANAFSDAAGIGCQPIWQFLNAGEYSLAYHFARALQDTNPEWKVPPAPLLGAVTLAAGLTQSFGPVAAALESEFDRFDSSWFQLDAVPDAWGTALNLLLIASTLRPMLLAPATAAGAHASSHHLGRRYPALYDLDGEVVFISGRMDGLRVYAASLEGARDAAALESAARALTSETIEWRESVAPKVTIKFAGASLVWRQWLRTDGIIDRLLMPVIEHNQTARSQVQEMVEQLSDPARRRSMIRHTDRVELKRRLGEEIHAGALVQLERHIGSAVGFAQRWLRLAAKNDRGADALKRLVDEARVIFERRYSAIRTELQKSPVGTWALVASAQQVVLREFDALRELFAPHASTVDTEPAPPELLGRGLLLAPKISLEDDWQPIGTLADIKSAVLNAVEVGTLTRTAAFEARLHRGDLHGARLILTVTGRDAAIAFEERLRTAHADWMPLLRDGIEKARREVELGIAYGYLDEAQRSKDEATLLRWERERETTLRFDVALAELRAIGDNALTSRAEMTKRARAQLDGIGAVDATAQARKEVEDALAEGDVATANELIGRAQRDLSPWHSEPVGTDPLTVFFPKRLDWLTSWLKGSSAVLDTAIRDGSTLEALDFAPLSESQRAEAQQLSKDWQELGRQKRMNETLLRRVLATLGFRIKRIKEPFDFVITEPIAERAICALPHFGSQTRGEYRIMGVWDRPTASVLIGRLPGTAADRPALVLYFGEIDARERARLASLARVHRRSFLLLDTPLIAWLCAERDSRLATFFSVATPFAAVNPYDSAAGLVPPEMFYGRGEELDALIGLEGRCFVYGGRQLGKTALLRRAEVTFHDPSQQRYSVWIDLKNEGIGLIREPSEVWDCIGGRLQSAGVPIDLSKPRHGARQAPTFGDSIAQGLRRFLEENPSRRILLLLDETDLFFEQDGRNEFPETSRLKDLMEQTGRRFKVVFAGLHNVLRMTHRVNHPLAHLGEPIRIGPLLGHREEREAEQLVVRPMAAAGYEFERRLLPVRILAQTNFYPSLIQLYCNHLVKHMASRTARGNQPGPRFLISSADVESVYASKDLRQEIRMKFQFTLQLDPRYEVVAYGIGYAILQDDHDAREGESWDSLRDSTAMRWWPSGFADTKDLEFRVLLDEMVELGVLRSFEDGRYTMRNPNVLLLLGTKEEIEAALVRERVPPVQFQSSLFRAPLRKDRDDPRRCPLTYEQLRAVLMPDQPVTLVAGTPAGGLAELTEFLGEVTTNQATIEALPSNTDRSDFSRELDRRLKRRTQGVTVYLVPAEAPWDAGWIAEAEAKVKRLQADERAATVLFLADPVRLWAVLPLLPHPSPGSAVWMTLQPWHESFVGQWLQGRQLSGDKTMLERLHAATGYWPSELVSLVTQSQQSEGDLARRCEVARAALSDPASETANRLRRALGLETAGPVATLGALAGYGDPLTCAELSELASVPVDEASRALRWGDLLGLMRREGEDAWALDPVLARLLTAASPAS